MTALICSCSASRASIWQAVQPVPAVMLQEHASLYRSAWLKPGARVYLQEHPLYVFFVRKFFGFPHLALTQLVIIPTHTFTDILLPIQRDGAGNQIIQEFPVMADKQERT